MHQHITQNKSTRLFIILAGFFIANALIAEVMGAKIFSLGLVFDNKEWTIAWLNNFPFHLTAGVLLWPIVFIMTDIINEYYGTKGVRFLSLFTVLLIIFAFIIFQVGIKAPPASWWETQYKDTQNIPSANAAYHTVLGQSQLIILGSLVAFLVGQLVDVFIFKSIKKSTGEKNIWARATGSTAVSQLVDSFVVLFVAFYLGPKITNQPNIEWSLTRVGQIALGNYIYKIIVAILLTPAIYGTHFLIEKYLGKSLATDMKNTAME
jgi:hypothetical protein